MATGESQFRCCDVSRESAEHRMSRPVDSWVSTQTRRPGLLLCGLLVLVALPWNALHLLEHEPEHAFEDCSTCGFLTQADHVSVDAPALSAVVIPAALVVCCVSETRYVDEFSVYRPRAPPPPA